MTTTKILKMDENNQYSQVMTKPLCIHKKNENSLFIRI